jgi:hypothetical protein
VTLSCSLLIFLLFHVPNSASFIFMCSCTPSRHSCLAESGLLCLTC